MGVINCPDCGCIIEDNMVLCDDCKLNEYLKRKFEEYKEKNHG